MRRWRRRASSIATKKPEPRSDGGMSIARRRRAALALCALALFFLAGVYPATAAPEQARMGIYLAGVHGLDFAAGRYSADFWLWSTISSDRFSPVETAYIVNEADKSPEPTQTIRSANRRWDQRRIRADLRRPHGDHRRQPVHRDHQHAAQQLVLRLSLRHRPARPHPSGDARGGLPRRARRRRRAALYRERRRGGGAALRPQGATALRRRLSHRRRHDDPRRRPLSLTARVGSRHNLTPPPCDRDARWRGQAPA